MQSLTISETQLVSGSGFTKVIAISGAVIGGGIGAAMSLPYAVLGLMVGFEGVLLSGVFLAAIAAIVAIITLPKIINDHKKEYNEWGSEISQQYWDHTYPYDPNSNDCYGPNC